MSEMGFAEGRQRFDSQDRKAGGQRDSRQPQGDTGDTACYAYLARPTQLPAGASVENHRVTRQEIANWLNEIPERREALHPRCIWDGDPRSSNVELAFTVQREALLRLARALTSPNIPRFNIVQYISAGRSEGIYDKIQSQAITRSQFQSASERVVSELRLADSMRQYPELSHRLADVVGYLTEAGCTSQSDVRRQVAQAPYVNDAVEGVCRNFQFLGLVPMGKDNIPSVFSSDELRYLASCEYGRAARRKIVVDILSGGLESSRRNTFTGPAGVQEFLALAEGQLCYMPASRTEPVRMEERESITQRLLRAVWGK